MAGAHYDVAIIGGGPAGSIAATSLSLALQPGRPKLTIKGPAESVEEIEAEYLLDCSGRYSGIRGECRSCRQRGPIVRPAMADLAVSCDCRPSARLPDLSKTASRAKCLMKRVLPICITLLFAGCAATPERANFEAASSEKALVRWYRKKVSLLCDAVCARSANGAVLVRLYKQSPAPLAEFRLDSKNYFVARGRLAGRGWAGAAPSAPVPFSSWIAFLAAYRESATFGPGSRQLQTAASRVTYTKSDGKLRTLNVSNTDTGEVISAVFK